MDVPTRKLSSKDLQRELRSFEDRYGMASSDFYDRFRGGELEEVTDFMRWAGLCYMATRSGVLARTPQHI